MSPSNLVELVTATLDPKALAVTVGKSAAKEIIRRVMQRRLSQARTILLEELASGRELASRVASEDDLIAMIYRYGRAASEGAARLNLRLMARMIRGGAATRPVYADEFLRYAPLIESLSRSEVLLVAAAYQSNVNGTAMPWEAAHKRLEEQGTLTANEARHLTQGLVRTGLVVFTVHAGAVGGGASLGFLATDLLTAIGQLAELEALPEEAA